MKVKKNQLAFAVLLGLFAAIGSIAMRPAAAVNPVGKGFAVVELFTSEGCSSCPAADKAVADALKTYPENVFVLGFHVDYWDYIGWKDRFSMASNDNRQRNYASAFSLDGVYTPQVVVNGKTEFTGSDRQKLDQSIRQGLGASTNSLLQLESRWTAEKGVTVSFRRVADRNSVLCVALVQRHAESAVKRGENAGAGLHHVNVVRDFIQVAGESGTARLTLPPDIKPADCSVIAFVQQSSSMIISGAASCTIRE